MASEVQGSSKSSLPNKGLEDVVAGQSSLCFIDGQRGILAYRGYGIDELGAHASFEEVVHLLWFGELPTRKELDETKAHLAASREIPEEVVALLRRHTDAHPMSVLRTAVSLLQLSDPDAEDMSREANIRKGFRLVGQIASIVAAFESSRRGLEPRRPRPELSQAGDFLWQLTGEPPDPVSTRVFDRCLVLHADHEFNASTFAARVTAATLSGLHSAVVSGIGTLKGPLHGGANTQVMETLKEIGSVENVEPWLERALAERRRLMGFGHRVYKTDDPRAVVLKEMSRELGERTGQPQWYRISERVQQVVHQEKGLYANVDFYSASTYYVMGIPIDLYTPIFAASRISGWSAHVLEQLANNRLIRPRSEYVGPRDRKVVPIDQR